MARRIKPFDDSLQKDRRRGTRDQSTDTSGIDAYRQGVELTSPKHFANGIAKIHDGYNDQSGQHGVPQLVYGQERPILRDDNSFLEGVKFDPVSRFEQFSFPAPYISAVNPSSGDTAGGTFVSLTGSGFFQTSRVRLDLISQVFTYVDDRHITFSTPAHAAGAVNVDVLTPGGSYTATGAYTFTAGSGPTVTSISPDLDDTSGGGLRTIIGTGFTGATAVTVDGVNVTGYSVISDTEIIAIMPTHAAAASLSILVTTPAGSNAANTMFTYWSPAELSLTGFWDRGNYQDTTEGTWPGRASAGTSGGRDLVQATAANQPAEVGLEPDFDGVNDKLGATFTLADLLASATGSVAIGCIPRTAQTHATAYSDPGLMGDATGGNFSLGYSSSGFGLQVYSAGEEKYVAAAVGAMHVVKVRYTGGSLDMAVDGNAFAAPVAITALGLLTTGIFVGWLSGTKWFDGSMRFIITSTTAFSDAEFALIIRWAQACRGLPA